VVVEKTGLYSFFIMFTIGITKGRWNTLLTALQQFKDDYDKNQPMWRMLPEFCAEARATSAWACATCATTSTTCTPSTTSPAW
jgi:arginine/lysine/ornithine decarboxylase